MSPMDRMAAVNLIVFSSCCLGDVRKEKIMKNVQEVRGKNVKLKSAIMMT